MAKARKRVPAKRSIPQAPKYPIAETIAWIRDGQTLLRKWGAIKSSRAKRVHDIFSKLLAMLETLVAISNVNR
jgi:hypothetical protein